MFHGAATRIPTEQPTTNHHRCHRCDFPSRAADNPAMPDATNVFSRDFAASDRHTGCARLGDFVEGGRMFGPVAPYLMAAFGMAFAGMSALTLIYAIGHLDAPETPPAPFAVKPTKS
jgi:hypothetical protein